MKNKYKIILGIKYKKCSACSRWKSLGNFYKNISRLDGLSHVCIFCDSLRHKKYHKKNSKKRNNYNKKYCLLNAKKEKQRKKITSKIYNKSNAKYLLYANKLSKYEIIKQSNNGLLEVKCAYCGRWLIPTNLQVRHRLSAINTTSNGESRFYCSENCKQTCPVYDQNKYPKGFKKATSREVVSLLRQLVLERDDYTCQMCGATTEDAQLHVHHEKSYTLNKIMANDPDNCWTLCKKCHKKVHSEHGCRYVDLKCSK